MNKFWSHELGGIKKESEWWLWIGFRSSTETAFFSSNPAQRAALLGLKEGTAVKLLEYLDNPIYAGELYLNPVGDPKYYSWRINSQSYGKLSVPYQSGYSLVEIKRVCKGQAMYRNVHLYDDSPIFAGPAFHTSLTREPREMWISEAKIEAKCQDGNKAVFRYGPTGSSEGGKPNFVVQGYFDNWLTQAWKKVPLGVQLEEKVSNKLPVGVQLK